MVTHHDQHVCLPDRDSETSNIREDTVQLSYMGLNPEAT